MTRQILAYSGVLDRRPGDTGPGFDLVRHAVAVSRRPEAPRLCFVPTGIGDDRQAVADTVAAIEKHLPTAEVSVLSLFLQPSVPDIEAHLLAQDVVLVSGGSVANLMVLWRLHGVDRAMRTAYEAGVVLTGGSAGSLCWHTGGPTDSFGDGLDAWTDGLGLLPWSNGVHDDLDDQPRRTVYRDLVASGALAPGYATEDGVGLHHVDGALHEAVSVRPGSAAWHVRPDGSGGWREERVEPRLLGSPTAVSDGA